jgi:LuxR family transcriptional regulator, maltose regulon positive regulatory protein
VTKKLAAATSAVAAVERDLLLETKLYVPGPRPGSVPRPRLAERLDEGPGQELILVCAPGRPGKTVLLADWARRANRTQATDRARQVSLLP